ncbi:MAG TPA: hypothetical protein DCR39_07635 [Nitrospiraceae bacterium]|nr:hypothetical protein [Nitrospiraceae bacterium]
MPYILERLENGSPNITGFINEVQGFTVRRIKNDELVNEDPDFRSVFNMNTQTDWQEANTLL